MHKLDKNKFFKRSLSEMSSESVSSSSSSLVLGGGGIWFYSNGLGTYYQITDTHGLDVLYYGTICQNTLANKKSGGKCDINLAPGCYIFRVDGAFDPDIEQISWDFCGSKGGAQTQLNFCVDDNLQCKPTRVDTAEQMCTDMITESPSTTVLTMSGTFHLGGMKVAELSEKDTLAIRNALVKEFSDASDSPNKKGLVEVSKLSWSRADPQADALSQDQNRRLDYSGFTAIVSFEANLLAERFGFKTVGDDGELKKLHHHMNNYLSRSMSEGIFAKKATEAARSVSSKNLESINFAKLGSVRVNYKQHTLINKPALLSYAIMIGSVLIGVAFSVMTYQSIIRQQSQSDDDYDAVIDELSTN